MHQILITEGSIVHVSLAYVEVEVSIHDHPNGGVVEILGCYCGISGDWSYFHMDNEGNSTISEELDFETQIAEIGTILIRLKLHGTSRYRRRRKHCWPL